MDVCKKNRKKEECTPEEWQGVGEQWIYTCVKRASYFLVSFATGKCGLDTCRKALSQFAKRLMPPSLLEPLTVFSDGNDDYTVILPEFFPCEFIDYGQLVKVRKGGRVVDKVYRVIYGNPDIGSIETTDVENTNGIMREHISRLVRKTKCHSKRKEYLTYALHIFQFYQNFMKTNKKKTTPAIIEKQTDHIWTWDDLLNFKIRYN